ncbi:MAG TPA: 5-(carboxyamino)imidazole ribonucleotide mutase [Alphaproteobacteria bacterium]|nr:5-(carboxyamino)imidazole ribonucleotide mutase [Alphaproteobacteria bacterium]
MTQAQPQVAIIMGSQSDWECMKNAAGMLEKLGIPYEAKIASAHRTPKRLEEYAVTAKGRGIQVIIAAAGMAAALPGAVAALTTLPVLGVPMEGRLLGGLDALLSMVQMPPGIPVGTLGVGRSGAKNAALLAAAIIALNDPKAAAALDTFRAEQTALVPEEPAS